MLRSLYSAVSGLRAHQTKMDVIGNNIANVNTYAFKSSRVVFKDIYYQTLRGANAPGTVISGTNPVQIGYGTTVGSIDVLNTRAGLAQTDRVLDLYIAGDGFFVVQDGSGDTNYTRLGNFGFDQNGNLVDSNGYKVCGGVPSLTSPVTSVAPITIPNIGEYSNISIGRDGTIVGLNDKTGTMEVLAQVAVTKFNNMDGLSQEGGLYLKESKNSGTPIYTIPGDGSGEIISGALEMSNVDLSKEFTEMITTQRGFQANSRIITVSDEMLQELVNLKR